MRTIVLWSLAAVLAQGMLVGCSGGGGTGTSGEHPAGTPRATGAGGASGGGNDLYTTQVQPILKANCYRCHGGMNHRGGLNLQTRAGMMKGGKSGPDVIPGDPEKSLLVTLLRHEGPAEEKPGPMPPAPRPRLSDADVAVVQRWVKEGALMPADEEKP